MTILVINNYLKEPDFWKAQAVADRLKGLGRDDCKILHYKKISKKTNPSNFRAIILSGSPGNLSKEEDFQEFEEVIDFVSRSDVPVLGICFGHQLIAKAFNSRIGHGNSVSGFRQVEVIKKDEILSCWEAGCEISLCQNHKEYVESIPSNFTNLAKSKTCNVEAMKHNSRPIYGVQAHIERFSGENPGGLTILKNFLFKVVDKLKTKQTILQCEADDFRRKVEESQHIYEISDCVYDKCIQEVSTFSLSNLRKLHETRIFRPFLLTWGTMGRVLGYEGVATAFGKIRSLSNKIEQFRKKSLRDVNLFDFRSHIIDLFNQLNTTEFKSRNGNSGNVGPTASSKILHLTCPDLFVMWDTAIRAAYGKSKGDGKEYFEFLLIMQTLMLVFETTINSLMEEYGKRPTRIIDQFNWMSTR